MIQHASSLRGTVATTSSLGRALTARWSAVWPEESLRISVLKFCCRQHSSHSKTLRGFMWQPVCPFSLSTKPHWSPTSTTLLVAIKCCQHFTMVCYILPSGLLQPPSPVRMPGYIGMTSGCLTQQVRNIARRCGGTQQQLQGVHVRIFCYLLQPPLMVK